MSKALHVIGKAMGKRKRKRERKQREKRKAVLLRRLGRFDGKSLLELLRAATSSPTARHRIASLSLLIDAVLRNPPTGPIQARPADLPELVSVAHEYEPRIATLEDYVPLDPRDNLVVRLGQRTYRIFPGARERPVADVIRTKQIATLIDPVIVTQLKFGLEDLLELVCRYTDHVISELQSRWSHADITRVEDLAHITEAELDAMKALSGIETFVDQCKEPDRAQQALEWATSDVSHLRFDPSDGNSSWGTALVVQRSDGKWTFPLPFVADAVAAATSLLAREALRLAPTLDATHKAFAENLVLRHLDRWANVMPHPNIASLGEVSAIAFWGEKHVLVVDVTGSLRSDYMPDLLRSSFERLIQIGPGTPLTIAGRRLKIPPDCEVVRLLIAGGTAHAMTPNLPGCVAMTLEDFRWVAETADDDADLFFFGRELVARPGIERFFSFETGNAWEYWRSNDKAFHRTAGGLSMVVVAHQIDSEWDKYAELAPLEELLALFDLPELDVWTDVKSKPTEEGADLVDTINMSGWKVSATPFPLAIEVVRRDLLAGDFHWVPSLGDALQFKITRLPRDRGVTSHLVGALVDGVRIEFAPTEVDPDDWPIRLLAAAERTLTIGVDSRVPDVEVAQPGTLEALLGMVFGSGLVEVGVLDRAGLDEFLGLWQQVQKALSFDAYHIPQRVQDPGSPLTTHISVRSEAVRRLAMQLRDKGTAPGRLIGRAAIDFENDHVYPALKELLQEYWSAFSLDGVLLPAMQELERASAKRERERQQLFFNVTRMPVAFDRTARSLELQQEASRLTRAITTIAELALREPPQGQKAPDEIDWRTMISIADLMLESAMRSEASHYGVLPVETELTDLFEIKTRELSSDSGFQPTDMHSAISEHQLARAQAGEVERSVKPGEGLIAAFPELADINSAFQTEFGSSLEVFLRVLTTTASIDVAPEDLIVRKTPEELAAWCAAETGDALEAVRAALSRLTLRATDLQLTQFEPWAFRERKVRLVTRPFIEHPGSGELYVMPWWVGQSFDVYERYIRNGRLPWPEVGTGAVKKALEEYRAKRNKGLEDDVGTELTTHGLPHKLRVKKASVLGIPALYGEIDAIVAVEATKTLWVLEVKDLGESFSIAEISRAIRAFFDADGYLTKLEKKVENVKADSEAAASNVLDVAGSVSGWTVRGAVVTRRPVPAGYVSPSPFPFVTLDRMSELIRP